MKKIIAITAVVLGMLSLAGKAQAASYTFNFSPPKNTTISDGDGVGTDLADLDHHYYFVWGLNLRSLGLNGQIQSATLTFLNINDWTVEDDRLYVHLLDNLSAADMTYRGNLQNSVYQRYIDQTDLNNNYGPLADDFLEPLNPYFAKNVGLIGEYTDGTPTAESEPAVETVIFDFSPALIAALVAAASDAKGNIGIGFDPDCHYYNDGVTLTITTLPDGGMTVAMLGFAAMGLATMRRRLLS